MDDRPKVGEILVSAGIIDEMQLNAALGEQSRWGRRLGVTLIKMGMVEEGHLIRALAKQLDLPVASLAGKRIPEEVIALVPARMASEHGVIPLFTKKVGRNGQLFLGMEDPSNLGVLDDLSFRTGMEIHPVMVGPTELGEAIDRYYHGRRAGAPAADPFRNGDTIGAANLRLVTDDSAQPGTAAVPDEGTPTNSNVVGPPSSRDNEVDFSVSESGSESASKSQPVPRSEVQPESPPISEPTSAPERGLDKSALEDIARAIEETERTRIVAKAITQLLIEKGLLSLEEIQAKIADLKASA